MTDKVKDIRDALDAATPGPWSKMADNGYKTAIMDSGMNEICTLNAIGRMNINNAHLIANAPEWLSYLLTELDTKDKESEHMQEALSIMRVMGQERQAHIDELEQQLDTAKQEYDDERASHNSHITELIDTEQRLKQAIEALESIHDMLTEDYYEHWEDCIEVAGKAISHVRLGGPACNSSE